MKKENQRLRKSLALSIQFIRSVMACKECDAVDYLTNNGLEAIQQVVDIHKGVRP